MYKLMPPGFLLFCTINTVLWSVSTHRCVACLPFLVEPELLNSALQSLYVRRVRVYVHASVLSLHKQCLIWSLQRIQLSTLRGASDSDSLSVMDEGLYSQSCVLNGMHTFCPIHNHQKVQCSPTVHSKSYKQICAHRSSPLLYHQIQHSIDIQIRIQTEVWLNKGSFWRSKWAKARCQCFKPVSSIKWCRSPSFPWLSSGWQRGGADWWWGRGWYSLAWVYYSRRWRKLQ